MAGPYDYTLAPQPISESVMQGFQIGRAIRDERAATAAKEQYATDLQAALQAKTPEAWAALSAKYPQQRQAFKQSWDMLEKAQQDAEFTSGVQAFGAINSGNVDAAKMLLDQRIAAMENSGQDPAKMRSIREALDIDPGAVANQLGLALSSIDPDRWGKMMTEYRAAQQAPAELTEKRAKAAKAATEAKFAESSEALRLQKLGWDITKVQEDIGIARENSRIAALNANIAREKSDLKRDEMRLKLNEAMEKRDTALREKVASVETGRASIDNMLNTADRILNTSAGVVDSAAGPVSTRLPTVSSDTADFEELVNTMASQAFMAQIPGLKGMGALSNAEGEKLQSSLQNLSLRQSPKRLLENVREAQRLMLKARGALADRYGVPDVLPDRPEAQTEREAAIADVPVADTSGFRVIGVER